MNDNPFPVGQRVRLRHTESREIGTVTGFEDARVIVYWPKWKRTGRYMPCSLNVQLRREPIRRKVKRNA